MKQRDRTLSYDDYAEQAQHLRERATRGGDTMEWQSIKTEAATLARSCPYFEIARWCFQIISQADTALQLMEDTEDYS